MSEAANDYSAPLDMTVGENPAVAQLVRYAPAIILLLTFAVYAQTLTYGFVYDDQNFIVAHPFVKSWHFLPRYFTGDIWQYVYPGEPGNYYRPLFLLWLLVHFTLFGLNPLWWHLTSVLAHLVVTFLVYLLGRRLARDRFVGLVAALVFGLHPVHIEGVAWITAVNEPLMAIFFLLSLLCYADTINRADPKDSGRAIGFRRFASRPVILSLVCFALALLTKETALVLPVIIFSFGVFFPMSESPEPIPFRRRLRSASLSVIPYAVLSAVYIVIRIAALGAVVSPARNVSVTTILYSVPSILLFYAKMLMWPVGVSVYNDQSHVVTPGLWNFGVPLAAVLAIACVIYLVYRRSRNEGTGRVFLLSVIWMMVPLLPAMNLSAFYPTEIGHDRYLYLPSFGFSLIVGLAVRGLPSTRAKLFGQPALQAATVVLLATALGLGTALQHYFWRDDLTFYSYGVRRAPGNPYARTSLADIMYGRQMYSEAGEQYRQVTVIDPGQWHSQYRLGLISSRQGRPQEAELCFRRAIEINTNSANVHLYLGLALYDLGQIDQSLDELHRALEINADTPNAHYGIGIALRRRGDMLGALREFKAELLKSPDNPDARAQIAGIEEKLK